MLEDELEFLKGDSTVRAGTGQYVFVPRGAVHGLTNAGDEPARFLSIVTPGGLHEKLLSGLGEPAEAETLPPPEGSPDVKRIVEIARKYDTDVLPPPSR